MLPETAIELVSQIVYRPGWTFEASDYTNRFEAAICVKVTYPAPETARSNWPAYEKRIVARASFPLQVANCDTTDLYRKIMDMLIVIEVHEAREIFRIQPTGWAPFHPHKLDGMERWGQPHADLAFGLV